MCWHGEGEKESKGEDVRFLCDEHAISDATCQAVWTRLLADQRRSKRQRATQWARQTSTDSLAVDGLAPHDAHGLPVLVAVQVCAHFVAEVAAVATSVAAATSLLPRWRCWNMSQACPAAVGTSAQATFP